jgi:hypothetical protein
MLLAPAEHFIHQDVLTITDEGLRAHKQATELNNNANYM